MPLGIRKHYQPRILAGLNEIKQLCEGFQLVDWAEHRKTQHSQATLAGFRSHSTQP
jgi:hypothetical protein